MFDSRFCQQIPPEAGYLFDAVTLYARAVNRSLKSHQDFRDGRLIFQQLRGQPYFSRYRFSIFFTIS